jgi:hypothetical protein
MLDYSCEARALSSDVTWYYWCVKNGGGWEGDDSDGGRRTVFSETLIS